MKFFANRLIPNFTINLIFVLGFAQDQLTENNYVLGSIERSISNISQVELPTEELENLRLDATALRAPNSYIFDLNLANENNYSGLKIPVKKAFDIWADGSWFLNQPLDLNGKLSAYVFWEDTHGLISNVYIENAGALENSKIVVMINPKKGKGNALISLHLGNDGNASDEIIWSWHVWVTDDPSNGVAYGQGIETDLEGNLFTPQYMDRNLGATYNHILGHDWHKTTGLLYQWGRKDPIPSFMYKDVSFYELNGLVDHMRNKEGANDGNVLPEVMRPFNDISSNLKFSIQNPIAYVLASDGTWFSSQQYRIMDDPNTSTVETVAWDLWSDNMRGENSNASSSNQQIKNDSRSYELKSPYDPCPNGWRIPSHLGRSTTNNNHSPWGRYNSGANDDTDDNRSSFYPDRPNDALLDVKVYGGLGVDFTNAHTSSNNYRNIGLIPITGQYVLYNNSGNLSIVYQDSNAITALWTSTYSLGGARFLKIISDVLRHDVSDYGLNKIRINEISSSVEALPVRCMRDPNLNLIGNFETEYISSGKTYFTKGLNNPNSYLITDETELLIPVNKAFSAYEFLFPEEDGLPYDNLVSNVYWTDNTSLIKSVKVIGNSGDARENFIKVELDPQQKGNAVISLHNGSINSPVYWSWHIWVPADEIREVTYVNQEILPAQYNFINATEIDSPPLTTTFMDRNLGALHDLPIEIIENPNLPLLQDEVKHSGGLHYQWGRKDPIPSFQYVGGESYEIYRGISVNNQGYVSYQSLNDAEYKNQFTEVYDNYKNSAGVQSTDPKYKKAEKVINYSVQNPLTLLHQGTTSVSDWASVELGVAADRWGHAQKKSIYDPCPNGWRVPDTFKVYEDGKGSSPWYNGKKTKTEQGSARDIGTHYGGTFVKNGNKAVGWFFTDSNYQIGHFPTTGIIGKFSPETIGGTNVGNAITGVWTSSLTQQLKGYALAMSMGIINDENHKMIATGNISPAYGLNVRCSKDVRVYIGDLGKDYFELDVRDFEVPQSIKDQVSIYPNPVSDFLYISVDKNWDLEVYDLQGRILKKGKFENKKINLSSLNKGVYIGLISNTENSEVTSVKIIKN